MKRAAILVLVAACGSNHGSSHSDAATDTATTFMDAALDAPMLPVFRNPVALPDDQLAVQAIQILGAEVPNASTRRATSVTA